MPATLFKTEVQVGLDTSPVHAGVTKLGTMLATKMGAIGSVAGAALSAGVTAGVTAGLATLAGSVVGVFKSIGLASEAEEAGSKFGFVFAGAADRTGEAIDEFAAKAGRSRFELRAMAADIGALVRPMGFSADATGDLSAQVVQLASDLSSFFNVSERDALESIRAGLVGESEPLRKFGVILNEGRIKSEAFALGLAKVGDELTATAKASAIMSLVFKDTVAAKNDAIRTAGSFANTLRALQGSIIDVGTYVGRLFMPAATEILGAMREISDSFKSQAPILEKWGKTIGEIVRNMLRLLSDVGGKIRDSVGEGLKQVISRITGGATSSFTEMITGLLDKLATLTSEWDRTWKTIQAVTALAWNEVSLQAAKAFKNIMGGVSEVFHSVGGQFKNLFSDLNAGLDSLADDSVAIFAGLEAAANKAIDNILSRMNRAGPLGKQFNEMFLSPAETGGIHEAFAAARGDSLARRQGVEGLLESLGLDPGSVQTFIAEHEKTRTGLLDELAKLWKGLAAARESLAPKTDLPSLETSTTLGPGAGFAAGIKPAAKAIEIKKAAEAFALSMTKGFAMLGTFGAKGDGEHGTPEEPKEPKSEFTGLSELSRRLQLSISNEDPELRFARLTAEHTKRMAAGIEVIKHKIGKPMPAMAG